MDVLLSMETQRVGHNLVTEQQQHISATLEFAYLWVLFPEREYYYHQTQQGSHYVLGFMCCLITLRFSTMPEDENEMERNLYPGRTDFFSDNL